ncbi:hypothetical protein ACFE04_028776 [Oxalis oulophora]
MIKRINTHIPLIEDLDQNLKRNKKHIRKIVLGLFDDWNKNPHLAGYVDFAESIKDHHPKHGSSFPWYTWSNCEQQRPSLSELTSQLETCLEAMARKALNLGIISSHQIFTTMNKWHSLNTSLRRILQKNHTSAAAGRGNDKMIVPDRISAAALWDRAVFALSAEIDDEMLEF